MTLYAISHHGAKQSIWPCQTKDVQTEQLLCWSGMTATEHSTTSGSKEEDCCRHQFEQYFIMEIWSSGLYLQIVLKIEIYYYVCKVVTFVI